MRFHNRRQSSGIDYSNHSPWKNHPSSSNPLSEIEPPKATPSQPRPCALPVIHSLPQASSSDKLRCSGIVQDGEFQQELA